MCVCVCVCVLSVHLLFSSLNFVLAVSVFVCVCVPLTHASHLTEPWSKVTSRPSWSSNLTSDTVSSFSFRFTQSGFHL